MLAIPAQYVIDAKGQKTAVLLPIATYEQLLEDLHDLAMVAQRTDVACPSPSFSCNSRMDSLWWGRADNSP